VFQRWHVFPRNQAGEFYISLRPSTFGKLAPTETRGMPLSAFLAVEFLTLLRINPYTLLRKTTQSTYGLDLQKYFDCGLRYLPFTGCYGSGSDEPQPVKQHSQGGALWMKLLTCPAAVHYRLLVAK
jgi:hypothetical protein